MSSVNHVNAFIDLFRSLPDNRQLWKIRHLLHEIIFNCITGCLCGCDDFESIEDFAFARKRWFGEYLTLPGGIPSHDTMERAFHALDRNSFILSFLEFTKSAQAQVGQGVVAIDAMGTQEAIALKIVETSGDYVLALKGNHQTLFEEVKAYFTVEVMDEIRKTRESGLISRIHGYCRLFGKAHGCCEWREYYITKDIKWMKDGSEKWPKLQSIGMVRYYREEKGQKLTDARYFITSIDPNPEKFAYCVRNHWGIESMFS